jgi:C4-dicarboxylate-specific signal transduction histidine kinase
MAHMDVIGRSGVRFFGKMSASISHDLKNVLAVINENAGLLEDLCLMAEKGKPLDPGRLKRLAEEVKNQVRRGDRIISSMNAFAHSADNESVAIDLRELLGLLVALSSRQASMRGVRLEIDRPSDAVTVTTSPFLLLNLLWFCLDHSMAAAGPGKTVAMAAEKTAAGARLKFSKLEGMDAVAGSFPAEPEGSLERALSAEIRLDPGSRELAVSLSGKVEGE